MSNDQATATDPLEFVRNMWGNMGFSLPGMVVPTFDVDELDKRITDLKAVEGWLRMNLSMLQMTIQGMEMQKATLTAVRAMGSMAASATQGVADAATASQPVTEIPAFDAEAASGAFSQAAMWPWNMMQQMQEHLQQQAAQAKAQAEASAEKPKAAARKSSRK